MSGSKLSSHLCPGGQFPARLGNCFGLEFFCWGDGGMFLETGSESPFTNISETGPEEMDTNCTVSSGRGGGDRGRPEEMAVPDTPSQFWSHPWGSLCCPSNRALEDGPTHSPAATVTAGKNHSPTSEGVLDLRGRALLPSPVEDGLGGGVRATPEPQYHGHPTSQDCLLLFEGISLSANGQFPLQCLGWGAACLLLFVADVSLVQPEGLPGVEGGPHIHCG